MFLLTGILWRKGRGVKVKVEEEGEKEEDLTSELVLEGEEAFVLKDMCSGGPLGGGGWGRMDGDEVIKLVHQQIRLLLEPGVLGVLGKVRGVQSGKPSHRHDYRVTHSLLNNLAEIIFSGPTGVQLLQTLAVIQLLEQSGEWRASRSLVSQQLLVEGGRLSTVRSTEGGVAQTDHTTQL